MPPRLECTSLYLHVPFCRNCCPYCPYTRIPYNPALVEPYTRAAIAEVDWWADTIGPAEIKSVYIGGGTPTLALGSIARVLRRVRERFRLTGDICIETNPADVDNETVQQLHDAGVALVSLGVQSFPSQASRSASTQLLTARGGARPCFARRERICLHQCGSDVRPARADGR